MFANCLEEVDQLIDGPPLRAEELHPRLGAVTASFGGKPIKIIVDLGANKRDHRLLDWILGQIDVGLINAAWMDAIGKEEDSLQTARE